MKCCSTISITIVWLSVAACTSTQTINQKYSSQLAHLQIGDSLDKFRELFPKAVIAGQNSVGGKLVDAYEVVHKHMYDQLYGLSREERLWFSFHDNRLVKWGPPNRWPDPADLVEDRTIE